MAVIFKLLRNCDLRSQNIQIVRRSRNRFIAAFKRLREVSRALVILRELPVRIGNRCLIGGISLHEILIHRNFFLRVMLVGNGVQIVVLRRARRDHNGVDLRMNRNEQTGREQTCRKQRENCQNPTAPVCHGVTSWPACRILAPKSSVRKHF